MRREYFGLLGSLLDDRELARFLVLHALSPPALRGLLRGTLTVEEFWYELPRISRAQLALVTQRETYLRVDIGAARRFALGIRQHLLSSLRANLDLAWQGRQQLGETPYSVLLHGGPPHLDRQWLAQIFAQEPGIGSLVFEANRPAAGTWSWPLRVGLPNTANGQQLSSALKSGKYRELYSPRVVARVGERVDLMLIPEPLAAVEDMFGRSEVLADAVLVLGDAEMDARDSRRRMQALMRQFEGGLSGLCYVPRGERGPWFQALVRELSHNQSLPSSLFAARLGAARVHEGGSLARELSAPVLFGDIGFVLSTSIGDTARRLALRLRELDRSSATIPINPRLSAALGDEAPETPLELGEAIEKYRREWGWQRESDEATTLVHLIRAVEQEVGPLDLSEPRPTANDASPLSTRSRDLIFIGGPVASAPRADRREYLSVERGGDFSLVKTVGSPPREVNRAPSPPPTGDHPPRHLQMDVLALDSIGKQHTSARVAALAPDNDYRLRIHIGSIRVDGSPLVATKPFDETQLPPSLNGHKLKIVYCPLSEAAGADGERGVPTPMQEIVHLPSARGDSDPAEFVLRVGADPAAFRARTIVLHDNCVLETHLLTADGDGHPRLEPENRYVPDFAAVNGARPADIAFVINDDPTGRPGLITIAENSAVFFEPPGLDNSLAQMRKLLTEANRVAAGRRKPALKRPETVKLLIQLANHGWAVLRELKDKLRFADLEAAARVQMVEAVDKAYFPVEFLYSGSAPVVGATLCPNAAAALAKQEVHNTCEHAGKSSHVCPAAFWGFHKCIERHPSTGTQGHSFSSPTTGNERLGPFPCALVAASEIAKGEMHGPKGVPTQIGTLVASVSQADSWEEWTQQIAALGPNLLLLMPHSLDSPDFPGLPALEVSGDKLTSSHFTAGHVHGGDEATQGPLVLLLGCSTALADTPFLGFVYRFYKEGAPVVVGTLATVHSSQAAMVACRVLAGIKSPSQPGTRFDEAMLQVRRQLLADGYEVALSLVAYGHSSWRI